MSPERELLDRAILGVKVLRNILNRLGFTMGAESADSILKDYEVLIAVKGKTS